MKAVVDLQMAVTICSFNVFSIHPSQTKMVTENVDLVTTVNDYNVVEYRLTQYNTIRFNNIYDAMLYNSI